MFHVAMVVPLQGYEGSLLKVTGKNGKSTSVSISSLPAPSLKYVEPTEIIEQADNQTAFSQLVSSQKSQKTSPFLTQLGIFNNVAQSS